jgi:hypothetical protein
MCDCVLALRQCDGGGESLYCSTYRDTAVSFCASVRLLAIGVNRSPCDDCRAVGLAAGPRGSRYSV